ncbi:MAG TPA: hypothetical protein VLJ57_03945 [Burkholderiaceae bacterium]|nr:hypothetical protein [Burkholderiaceae bacterium]
MANISLNNLSPLNPCAATSCWYSGSGKQAAPWRNWCGGAFAREYSSHGAVIYWGGGHGGGDDHSLYLFDFSTRLWSRIGPTLPSAPYALDSTWSDFQHEGSYIVPGLHTYNYPSYVPPGKSGVGAKGAWILPALVSGPGGNVPHAVDLASGQWTRFSAGKAGGFTAPYSGTIEDTKRGRIWWGGAGAHDYRWMDYNEAHPRTIKTVNSRWFGGWYDRFVYVPEADMAMGFWCDFGQTQFKAVVLNMSSGAPVAVASNAIPAKTMLGAGFGADWCPITRKFYFYEARARAAVSVLAPSSLDFSSCTWSWGEETFTGAAPAWIASGTGSGGEIALSRWRYVPALRSFAWSDGPRYSAVCEDGATRDGVMQVWRPLGT